jgi:hypothetical protein
MKRFAKILVRLGLGGALLIGAFILLIGFQWRRSQHQVEQIVASFKPHPVQCGYAAVGQPDPEPHERRTYCPLLHPEGPEHHYQFSALHV